MSWRNTTTELLFGRIITDPRLPQHLLLLNELGVTSGTEHTFLFARRFRVIGREICTKPFLRQKLLSHYSEPAPASYFTGTKFRTGLDRSSIRLASFHAMFSIYSRANLLDSSSYVLT
jgi:hypothetical protein